MLSNIFCLANRLNYNSKSEMKLESFPINQHSCQLVNSIKLKYGSQQGQHSSHTYCPTTTHLNPLHIHTHPLAIHTNNPLNLHIPNHHHCSLAKQYQTKEQKQSFSHLHLKKYISQTALQIYPKKYQSTTNQQSPKKIIHHSPQISISEDYDYVVRELSSPIRLIEGSSFPNSTKQPQDCHKKEARNQGVLRVQREATTQTIKSIDNILSSIRMTLWSV